MDVQDCSSFGVGVGMKDVDVCPPAVGTTCPAGLDLMNGSACALVKSGEEGDEEDEDDDDEEEEDDDEEDQQDEVGSARVSGTHKDSESFVSEDSGVTHMEGSHANGRDVERMVMAMMMADGLQAAFSMNGACGGAGSGAAGGVGCCAGGGGCCGGGGVGGGCEPGPSADRLPSKKSSRSLPPGLSASAALRTGERARKSATFPRGAYEPGSGPVGHMAQGELEMDEADTVSRSSLSSLSSDLSAGVGGSAGAVAGSDEQNRQQCQSAADKERTSSEASDAPHRDDDPDLQDDPKCHQDELCEDEKPKRIGLATYITRNILTWRNKDCRVSVPSPPGWKLFGRVPPKESPQKDPKKIQQEYEARIAKSEKAATGQTPSRKDLDFEPLSTTALILEQRPAHLPAKPVEEMQRHQELYAEMVSQAKKREAREAQRQKQLMQERCKKEDSIISTLAVWNTEILPNWEQTCNSRKVRDLWWQGIPPSIRGKIWSLAIGNELNITPELYEIFLSRAKEKWRSYSDSGSDSENGDVGCNGADRESSLELISLDISRTFPSLCIFQKRGPYHDILQSVLGAYTCYRPDVGYVQGMSFLAAVLLLNLDVADAFITFANLLNKPCQMAFFRVDHPLMLKYFEAFELFFEENLPRLFSHFKTSNLTPDLYLIDWIFTLYSKALPLDVACRVWDVFCRDGEEFLFRTALGILRLYQDVLLSTDFLQGAQFLTRLPDNIAAQPLFAAIGTINMQNKHGKWSQVFSALQKDRRDSEKSGSP
ncbi:TBC1 domain family member 14-like isoform X1 [Lampetra fluviatilis]